MTDKNIAIRVSHPGKKYSICGPQEKYLPFRDAIVSSVKAPIRRLSSSAPPQEFRAQKDVSFDSEPGGWARRDRLVFSQSFSLATALKKNGN